MMNRRSILRAALAMGVVPSAAISGSDAGVPVLHEAIMWNPGNKVVQDHRDGMIYRDLTDRERARRGLPVPWTPGLYTKTEKYLHLPDIA